MSLASPAVENFELIRGEDKGADFPITDKAGAAVTVTSWTAVQMDIFADKRQTTPVLSKSIANGKITLSGSTITASFVEADYTTLTAPSYFYRLNRMDSGLKSPLAEGEITIIGPAIQ